MPLITSGAIKGRRCPICGAEHTSCGLPYQGEAVAIPEEPTVADTHDLYIYEDAQGHTFQMTEADAKESGYTRVGRQTTAAAEQERAAESEATSPELTADPAAKAAESEANKARTPGENK